MPDTVSETIQYLLNESGKYLQNENNSEEEECGKSDGSYRCIEKHTSDYNQ